MQCEENGLRPMVGPVGSGQFHNGSLRFASLQVSALSTLPLFAYSLNSQKLLFEFSNDEGHPCLCTFPVKIFCILRTTSHMRLFLYCLTVSFYYNYVMEVLSAFDAAVSHIFHFCSLLPF